MLHKKGVLQIIMQMYFKTAIISIKISTSIYFRFFHLVYVYICELYVSINFMYFPHYVISI